MRNIFLIFVFISILSVTVTESYAKIEYKVSGKVVHNGNGVKDIEIHGSGTGVFRRTLTNRLGEFHLYLPCGIHSVSIPRQKGFLPIDKDITVSDKNIDNVIFVLEKGCTVTGIVTCEDGSPLYGWVTARNERGARAPETGEIGENGQYTASGIPAAGDTRITAQIIGMPSKSVEGYVLEEGQILNIDFIFPDKKRVVYGKVIDKMTKEPVKLEDGLSVIINNFKYGPVFEACNALLNENGEFFIYNLKPGKYTVAASSFIYKDSYHEITIVENKEKYLVIEMEKL